MRVLQEKRIGSAESCLVAVVSSARTLEKRRVADLREVQAVDRLVGQVAG